MLYGIMIVIMIYLGLLPILQTKDPVSIKLFLNGVIIFLIAFILWNIGNIPRQSLSQSITKINDLIIHIDHFICR